MVEKKEGSKDWVNALDYTTSDKRCNVQDLTTGSEYTFRVRAENSIGMSEPSKPSRSVVVGEEPGVFVC